MDKKQIEAIVARVTEEVRNEVAANEIGNFRVEDLKSQLDGLSSKGNTQAWKITYDTSSSALATSRNETMQQAWKITYDTSSSALAATDISQQKK